MDFVYPLGGGSLHKDFELGISMKSVRKFVSDAGKLFVIGKNPWTNPGVEFTLFEKDDDHSHKQFNTMEKMKLACKNPAISDPFIYMNDDFFISKPITCRELPLVHQGSIKAHIQHRSEYPNNYLRALKETQRQLLEHGLPQDDFELHCPMPVHKMLMLKTLATFDWSESATPLMRSLYGNHNRLEANFLMDVKLSEPLPRHEIARRISDNKFFSIGDGALVSQSDMKNYLLDMVSQTV